MSTFIKLDKQDAYITSYTAHKSWLVNSSSLDEYGIEVYHAFTSSYLSEDLFDPNTSSTVGARSLEYSSLVYESIKHLYYDGVHTGAEFSSSYDDYKQTTLYPSMSRNLGEQALVFSIPQDVFGSTIKPGTFALGSDIPVTSYVSGGYVMTGYFITTGGVSYNIFDNGEGVLLESGSLNKVGDIVYTHGLAIITDTGSITSILNLTGSCTTTTICPTSSYVNAGYVSGSYFITQDCNSTCPTSSYVNAGYVSGSYFITQDCNSTCPTSSYVNVGFVSGSYFITQDCNSTTYYVHPGFVSGGYFIQTPTGSISSTGSLSSSLSTSCEYGYNVCWQSTYEIYTHNYRCTVRDQDLLSSHNPTLKSGSEGDLYDFATGSYFQPYVTTVGLYNDSDELIAIGKLSQPVPKSRYTDMTFVVKLDM